MKYLSYRMVVILLSLLCIYDNLINVVYVPTCLRASVVYVPTCLHAKVPKTCQVLTFMCQRATRCGNVSTWHANVPNGVPVFQLGVPTCQRACQFFKHSSYEMLREISILYYYIKNSTLYLISYLYISCVYVSYI